MKEFKILSIETQLKKMAVVIADRDEKLGQITDLIIHPTNGSVPGLIIRTFSGTIRAVAAEDFFIFSSKNVVMVLPGALSDQISAWEKMGAGVGVCREIIGARVVTELGKNLGYVCEALLVEEPLQVIYRVVESRWQKWFGAGFYMAADIPNAWSHTGRRLLVPADAAERCCVLSPRGLIKAVSEEEKANEEPQWAGR